ncbi:MAG TPA: hypothetical protein EYG88_05275 [Desulfocapsa sulfexigens]|nr:hypothetical protein [Desulfocapsa sulfexigens]
MKILLIVAAVVLAGAGGFFFYFMKGPALSRYEYLKNPRITTIPDTNVLEIPFATSADGLKEVFDFLFKNYFKLKGAPKRAAKMAPPLARYENALDFEMEEEKRKTVFDNMIWKGVAAIPLPADITSLPDLRNENLTAAIACWQYGEIAEILHVGPYEKEASTVRKLMKFIDEQGYEVSGFHEEVYLHGPGSPFSKPEKYYTIIRYPVEKKKQLIWY